MKLNLMIEKIINEKLYLDNEISLMKYQEVDKLINNKIIKNKDKSQ